VEGGFEWIMSEEKTKGVKGLWGPLGNGTSVEEGREDMQQQEEEGAVGKA